MTDGDLTTRPNPWGRDEAASLMGTLSDMQMSLRGIVSRVRSSSDSMVHASSEIASASSDLSARTEQAASNLEESASSMEQIASTVKHTADSVQQAADVAANNSVAAARGGEVIAQVVSTMQGINASSNKISDIIGTIDGIAFQTNILALNAAVEAARGGRAGARLRGSGQRGAQPRATQRFGGPRNQGAHHRQRRQGRGWLEHRAGCGADDGRTGQQRPAHE